MSVSGAACLCSTLPDLAVVPMGGEGLDEKVFATVELVWSHGGTQWWLYLARCTACGQDWMVAQESRIHDNHYLKRIDAATARAILESGDWPEDFLTFERVLTLGRTMGERWEWADPFAHGLQFSVEDLRKERPSITAREIGWLLGLSDRHARMVYWKVRLFGADKLS